MSTGFLVFLSISSGAIVSIAMARLINKCVDDAVARHVDAALACGDVGQTDRLDDADDDLPRKTVALRAVRTVRQ